MMTLQLPFSPDGGHDETPADGFDGLAEAAHQLYVGYMAAGFRKGKTKGFKGKDKGKGKGKHIFRTQLSVQDRVMQAFGRAESSFQMPPMWKHRPLGR